MDDARSSRPVTPKPPYVGAIDQGTTGTRFVVFDADREPIGDGFVPHDRRLAGPDRVEYDPIEIWECTRAAIQEGLDRARIDHSDLAALGIATQRQTTVLWDEDGTPVAPAQSWQDRRAADLLSELSPNDRSLIVDRTGLVVDPYFAGAKLAWLLENGTHRGQSLREMAQAGQLRFGTIDAWLVTKLTGRHRTDVTNASQTMLFDQTALGWDDEILDLLDLPESLMPEACPSSHPQAFGRTSIDGLLDGDIPVTGVLGNQQAALVGHGGSEPGDTKVSYGSGNFALQHVGTSPVDDASGLLGTIWYQGNDERPLYGVEGPIFTTGTALEWLSNIGLLGDERQLPLSERIESTEHRPVVVPTIGGMGAPGWTTDRGGTMTGFTRFTDQADLLRATVDGIGFATRAVLDAIEGATGLDTGDVSIDGGAIADDTFAARQATLLDRRLVRPGVTQVSALGAATAAADALDLWGPPASGVGVRTFYPDSTRRAQAAYERWCAVARESGYLSEKEGTDANVN